MNLFISLLSGFIFAIGLGISGMMNPKKVQSFLNITGQWDPSLLFVMGSALLVGLISFHFILKRKSPICEKNFAVPTNKKIDRPLIFGSILFGTGWAIAGLCPGPALANLTSGNFQVLVFVFAMMTGIIFVRYYQKEK